MRERENPAPKTLLSELSKPFARARRRYIKRKYRNQPRFRAFPGVDGQVLDACIAHNHFGAYCVPWHLRKRPAARKVFAGTAYEEATINLMVGECNEGDMVHAGTFFGDFLPALSRGVESGAAIWAFEPNRESFRCADLTCRLNNLNNVQLEHAGLGAEMSELAIRIADEGGRRLGGKSHLLAESYEDQAAGVEQVRVVTVDEAVPAERSVSVVQLDVEGFETQALAGAMGTITRCRPLIILETLPPQNWIDENLVPLGYHMAEMVDRNFVFRI